MDVQEVQQLFESVMPDVWIKQRLKREQLELITGILNKKKVSFGILPTGFGKSYAFVIPPLLLDQIEPEKTPHVALIISPLRSLMIDQVQRWTQKGIKCSVILQMNEMDPNEVQSIMRAEPTLVFTSPEAIMLEPWRSMLHNSDWINNLCLVCCDEAHCIHEWGLDFRPSYQKVAELRAVADVPWIFLTATCTSDMFQTISKTIGFPKEPNIVASLPDRQNIYLEFVSKPDKYYKELQNILDKLLETKLNMEKTIIYCSNTEDVCNIFDYFYSQLGNDIFIPGKNRHLFGAMLVGQYHRGIGKAMEKAIIAEFIKPDSSIRVLISTVAFGMGVQVDDIAWIVHWGLSSTIPAYWQEVGRAGRDGRKSHATLFAVKVDQRYTSKEFCKLTQDLRSPDAPCMRKMLLEQFVLPESDTSALSKLEKRVICNSNCEQCECAFCTCCSICKTSCPCNKKTESTGSG